MAKGKHSLAELKDALARYKAAGGTIPAGMSGPDSLKFASDILDRSGSTGNPAEDAVELARETGQLNRAAIDDLIKEEYPEYEKAGKEAQQKIETSVLNMVAVNAGIPPIEIPKFVGQYTSQAARSTADKQAVAAEKVALQEYRTQIKPQITPAEQAMFEVSRRRQEQELQAQRGAAMRDLQSRGFAGGGMELASQLGAEQETAQRRMLEDLQTQGMAIGRAGEALKAYGSLAGQIRGESFGEAFQRGSAADEASRFNRELQQNYDAWKADEQLKQQQALWGRTKDVTGAEAAAAEDAYRYQTAPLGFKERATETGVGFAQQGAQEQISAMQKWYGAKQAQDAADRLANQSQGLVPDEIPILGAF